MHASRNGFLFQLELSYPQGMGHHDLLAELRRMREAAGLTQAELGEALGHSQGWTQKIEAGNRGLPADLLGRWAEACGFTHDVRFHRAAPGVRPRVPDAHARLLVDIAAALPHLTEEDCLSLSEAIGALMASSYRVESA